MGGWLRGRALPSHGRGHWFKSSTAHHFLFFKMLYIPLWTLNLEMKTQVNQDSPIMVGGSGSAGTSLLSQLLNAHPEIYCGPEWYLLNYKDLYEKFEILTEEEKRSLITEGIGSVTKLSSQLVSDSLPKRDRTTARYRFIQEKKPMNEAELIQLALSSKAYKEFIDGFFNKILQEENKKRWAEKTPLNCYCIQEFLTLYPNGKYVHVIRDGRDVALSLIKRKRSPRQAVQRWLYDNALALPYEGHPSCYILRYEDLVAEPVPTLEKLLVFLEMDTRIAPELLEKATQKEVLSANKPSWKAHPNEPISNKAVGKWKKMDKNERYELEIFFQNICLSKSVTRELQLKHPINANELLRHFNYETEGCWETRKWPSRFLLNNWVSEKKLAEHKVPYFDIHLF
jgi:hypothetical protein